MGLERFLQEWNRKIEDQRQSLLNKGAGSKVKSVVAKTWWQRNYISMLAYAFIVALILLCLWVDWVWPARILGLMLFINAVSFLWTKIKQAWTWLKVYLAARKLLKQASRLKRE